MLLGYARTKPKSEIVTMKKTLGREKSFSSSEIILFLFKICYTAGVYGGNFSNLSWSGDGGRSRLAETGNYIKLFLLSSAIFCFWSFVDWFGNGLNYLFLMHTRWRNSTSKENAFLSPSTDSICSLCNGNCFSVDKRLPADSLGLVSEAGREALRFS